MVRPKGETSAPPSYVFIWIREVETELSVCTKVILIFIHQPSRCIGRFSHIHEFKCNSPAKYWNLLSGAFRWRKSCAQTAQLKFQTTGPDQTNWLDSFRDARADYSLLFNLFNYFSHWLLYTRNFRFCLFFPGKVAYITRDRCKLPGIILMLFLVRGTPSSLHRTT